MADFEFKGKLGSDRDIKGLGVEGDYVYQYFWTGGKEVIGVTKDYFNATVDLKDKYYNRLVELKDIVEPKTSEEMLSETQETLKEVLSIIKQQQAELNSLKGGGKSEL